MSERIKGQIIEIDPEKKYALLVKEKMSDGDYRKLLDNLDRFMKSEKTFVVIDGTHVEIFDLSEDFP
jgi:hypothetical protein